jgi:serine/threonine protein kinase
LVMRSILLGLGHIHYTNDLVHRDIKPSNIVIDDLNDMTTMRIADFGLAVKLNEKAELLSTCGTLIYQAPEQIFSTVQCGQTVDIFAAGFILFELLTGGKHPILMKGEDK